MSAVDLRTLLLRRPMTTVQKQISDGHQPDAIVFFDGVCGFCSHTVNFLMARDVRRRLRFAPLQGRTAHSLLPPEYVARLDSLVFRQGQRLSTRSAAVVRILVTVGGIWMIVGILLWLIPFPLRDLGYRGFAGIRYRLFGRHDTCRMPRPEERGLVLD